MNPSIACAALLAACAIGCASFQPSLTSPAHGGPAWTELSSRHYVLRTDLPPEEARAALAEFERVYNLFVDVAFPTDERRAARIGVVVFARERDYLALGRKGARAYFNPWLPNDAEPEPTAVMWGQLVDETRVVFQHELTHHFMRQSLSHLPVWLNEGMAELYSTLRAEDGKVFVGAALPSQGFTRAPKWLTRANGTFTRLFVPVTAVPPVDRIVGMTPEAFYASTYSSAALPTIDEERATTANYAGSWALVHMLMTSPGPYKGRFGVFLDGLAHGKSSRDAWAESFQGVDPTALEGDFRAYLLRQEYALLVKAYAERPPEPPLSERTMSEAEVHLLWARLDKWTGGSGGRPRGQLDEALAAEPSSPEVHFWRALYFASRKDLDAAGREIGAAVQAKPGEPRYLLVQLRVELARTAGGPAGEAVRVLSDRLAAVAATPIELDAVARARARLRSADEGLPFAERAVKTGPTCWGCLDTYALLLAEKKRFAEAAAAEERAIERMPEGVRDAGLQKRLRRYQDAAATAP